MVTFLPPDCSGDATEDRPLETFSWFPFATSARELFQPGRNSMLQYLYIFPAGIYGVRVSTSTVNCLGVHNVGQASRCAVRSVGSGSASGQRAGGHLGTWAVTEKVPIYLIYLGNWKPLPTPLSSSLSLRNGSRDVYVPMNVS